MSSTSGSSTRNTAPSRRKSSTNDTIAAFLRKRGAAAVPFNQIYGPELPQGVTLSPLLDKDDLLTTLHKAGLLQADTTRF